MTEDEARRFELVRAVELADRTAALLTREDREQADHHARMTASALGGSRQQQDFWHLGPSLRADAWRRVIRGWPINWPGVHGRSGLVSSFRSLPWRPAFSQTSSEPTGGWTCWQSLCLAPSSGT